MKSLLQSSFVFSQTSEIVKILNRELKDEIFAQNDNTADIYSEKFELIKTANIKDSIQQMRETIADGTEDVLVQNQMNILSLKNQKTRQFDLLGFTKKANI